MESPGSASTTARSVAGRLAIAAMVLDDVGNVVDYNTAAEALLGTTFEERGVLRAPSWPAELNVRSTDREPMSLDELMFWVAQPPVRRGTGRARFDGLDGREHYVRLLATELFGDAPGRIEGTLIMFWPEEEDVVVTDRRLATVVFTDLVRSTERLSELGDSRWVKLLEAHDGMVRGLAASDGHVVNTTGDGALLTFESPGRAIAFGRAIRERLLRRRLEVRVAIHSGEVEIDDRGGIGGIVVHIAARILGGAEPGEILVSRTIVDLVAGSGIEFKDRGEHELKGVPGTWRLYALGG